MAKTERYETVIRLNTEQAKKEIDVLEKKIADLRKKQSSYAPDSKQFKNLEKEINKNVKQLEMMQNRLTAVNKAIRNMSDASPRQLRNTIKDINELLNSGNIKRGGEDWKALNAALKEANTELARIKNESKASQPALSKFFKFLNDSSDNAVDELSEGNNQLPLFYFLNNIAVSISIQGSKLTLTWNSYEGQAYTVRAANTLDAFEDYIPVGSDGLDNLGYFHMPATPPYNTAEINLTGADARFFKIRVDNLTDEAR